MRRKKGIIILLTAVMLFTWVLPVSADGIIIPDPIELPPEVAPMTQLNIEYHHVEINIENQIAVTHVDQVFYNPNDWTVEGTYIFPLPVDAVVNNFILWIDNEPIQGEILEADEAREIYEEIVYQLQDPALLEYIGRGAVQARVFPIEPGQERRIELEYTQVLTTENELFEYVYPLNTEKFSGAPIESVQVTVNVQSDAPLRAVYSPTHPVAINQPDNNHFTATYSEKNIIPDKDFGLFYSVGETAAFHLLTYRNEFDEDNNGYFMLLMAPSPDQSGEVAAKDLLLVLDRSGSMEGEKFEQAKAALNFILDHLNPNDRFYLSTFSTDIQSFNQELVSAQMAEEAKDWVNTQFASGSTDINRALLEAAAAAENDRPTYLIFLTDGLPTEGVIDSDQILNNFLKQTKENIRLFAFGVGFDVDTFLLDSLTQENHGLSTYVQPDEALDETLSQFYEGISTPVLTNLSLDFGSITTYDLYPNPLPDLFANNQVIVTGRYQNSGETTITLTGELNGEEQVFEYENVVFEKNNAGENSNLASLPRIWASRKIGYLLKQIRLQGANEEIIDQIIALSIRFGIVTPYTSYLVTEPVPLTQESREDLSEEAMNTISGSPTVVYGKDAVEQAEEEAALEQAEVAPAASTEGEETIRAVWDRSFLFSNGIWIDTNYDPENMTTWKIAFLSKEYFELMEIGADVQAALALGQNVIIVLDGNAYEITEGETSPDLVIPESTTNGDTEESESISEPVSSEEIQSEKETENEEEINQVQISEEGFSKTNILIYTAIGFGLLVIFVALIFVIRKKVSK